MKICFPVKREDGLDSRVFGHFGSAPKFIIFDSDANSIDLIDNQNLNHQHGQCQPIRALAGHSIDIIVVGGIGGGALQKLNMSGVKVYKAGAKTVKENIDEFKAGKLAELTMNDCCSGHGHGKQKGHTCGH